MPDHTPPDLPPAAADGETPPTYWEKRVDAMDSLLCARVPGKYSVEQHRGVVEALPAEEYARLSHYERWVVALKETAVRNGLLSEAEIEQRVAALRGKAEAGD